MRVDLVIIEARSFHDSFLYENSSNLSRWGSVPFFSSLSLSPWILHEINFVPLIMHEQSAWLLFETGSCLAICIRSNVAVLSLLFQSRLPLARDLAGDCATEAFPLFSKLPTASLLLSIAALFSFTESKFALHGKTRRNVIHISRMIHLCSLSRLFIKRGSRLGSKSRISGHAC